MEGWSAASDETCGIPGHSRVAPVFQEPLSARCRRWLLGSAYALQPKRFHLMPRVTALTIANMFHGKSVQQLLRENSLYGEEGLLGISDDLSVEAISDAYSVGAFPFCHLRPMKWWNPATRAVLFFENTHVEKGTLKLIKRNQFDIAFDKDFAGVMRACAEPRDGRTPLTWLTPKVMDALWRLHQAGHAHSIEVRDDQSQLVGGIFGIAIGGIFFGESQFSKVRDVSKIASAILNCHLSHWGFAVRDAKWLTPHLTSLGFTTVDREAFSALLRDHIHRPGRIGPWEFDKTLDVAQWAASLRKARHA